MFIIANDEPVHYSTLFVIPPFWYRGHLKDVSLPRFLEPVDNQTRCAALCAHS